MLTNVRYLAGIRSVAFLCNHAPISFVCRSDYKWVGNGPAERSLFLANELLEMCNLKNVSDERRLGSGGLQKYVLIILRPLIQVRLGGLNIEFLVDLANRDNAPFFNTVVKMLLQRWKP